MNAFAKTKKWSEQTIEHHHDYNHKLGPNHIAIKARLCQDSHNWMVVEDHTL